MADAIAVSGLSRSFGDVVALDGVDLVVAEGTVFGLLGPNGAGKTTAVRLLNGLIAPDRVTSMRVLGYDVGTEAARMRRFVGVQTDTELYLRLSARENLETFGRLYGMPPRAARARAMGLLERFGLAERAGERLEKFSKGMRQKVAIARALVSSPRLVFLDEPTAGLDPESSHDLLVSIERMSAAGEATFFLTSHRLDEIERVCDEVAVLARGRILRSGAPRALAREVVTEHWVRVTPVAPGIPSADELAALPGVTEVRVHDGALRLRVATRGDVPGLLRAAASLEAAFYGVAEEVPTLEDAYLRLVGDDDGRDLVGTSGAVGHGPSEAS
jgi:ABC-2 type transport system ATP-binding protein